MANQNKRLLFIDALRGVGALMVLFFHVPHHVDDTSKLDLKYLIALPLDFGYLGVTLFLVVSGFCIHLTAAKSIAVKGDKGFSWRSFWKRRFHRLYPPYFITILFSLLLTYFGMMLVSEKVSPLPGYNVKTDLLLHIFMLHNLFSLYCFGFAIGNGALWSLGLEEQLYALYAAYLWVRRRMSAMYVLGLVLLTTLAWLFFVVPLGPSVPDAGHRWYWLMWPFSYWFYWVLGAVAAEAYKGACRLPRWCSSPRAALLLCLCAVAISHPTLGRVTEGHFILSLDPSGRLGALLNNLTTLSDPLFASCFFVLVNYGVKKEAARHQFGRLVRALGLVGVMSYSLYLIHQPLIFLLEAIVKWEKSPGKFVLRYLIFVPVALATAWVFYLLVERRFLNRRPPAERAIVPEALRATS